MSDTASPTSNQGSNASVVGPQLLNQFDSVDPEASPNRPVVFGVWLVWTALALLMVFFHEPWRDELQAWGIARDSATPFDLLSNTRHEGHPPLWFVVLWPIAKVTSDAIALQFVTLLLGCGATWLTLRHMPVRLWIRIALVFGYFPLFEFGVMSRNYSLAYTLVIVFLWLSHRERTPQWLPALVAFAVAATAVNSMPLAIGLSLAVWGGPWFASLRRGPINWKWLTPVFALAALAAMVALPAMGGGRKLRLELLSPSNIWNAFAAPARALAPFSELTDRFYSNPLLANYPKLAPYLGVALIVAVAFAVRRSRSALTIWLTTSILLPIIIVATVMPIGARYISPFFSALVAAVWFAAADRNARPRRERPPVSPFVAVGAVALLAMSLWAGLWATWVDNHHPFSGGDAAAEWIEANATGDRPIVILCAANAPLCSSVSIRLDAPAYMRADGKPFAFVDWKPGWNSPLYAASIATAARQLEQRTGAEVFIVATPTSVPPGCSDGHRTPSGTFTEYFVVCNANQLVGT